METEQDINKKGSPVTRAKPLIDGLFPHLTKSFARVKVLA